MLYKKQGFPTCTIKFLSLTHFAKTFLQSHSLWNKRLDTELSFPELFSSDLGRNVFVSVPVLMRESRRPDDKKWRGEPGIYAQPDVTHLIQPIILLHPSLCFLSLLSWLTLRHEVRDNMLQAVWGLLPYVSLKASQLLWSLSEMTGQQDGKMAPVKNFINQLWQEGKIKGKKGKKRINWISFCLHKNMVPIWRTILMLNQGWQPAHTACLKLFGFTDELEPDGRLA